MNCVFTKAVKCTGSSCVSCAINPKSQEQTERCHFRAEIDCKKGNCKRCGWCPAVEASRIADIRERFRMAREILNGTANGKSWVWRYRQVDGDS